MTFEPFEQKMRSVGLPDLQIEAFRRHYGRLAEGYSGLIGAARLEADFEVPSLTSLPDRSEDGRRALGRTVMLKLNGGLGTSMGLDRAKSLLPVKPGWTFLDVIASHVLNLRQTYGVPLPLLFMNSFRTQADTLGFLEKYPDLPVAGLPLSFVQGQVPRIRQDDLSPAVWPSDPSLEWCPPGHGDIYTVLKTSGLLEGLLDGGYEYAYVSNADNMGSMLDPAVLGQFVQSGAVFMMEVATRLPLDRKGGHLGRYRTDGRWMLRELAHCPPDELENFQNVERFRYFNTNNIWWHLPSLARTLAALDFLPDLPLIINRKTLDPTRPAAPSVFQLETAIGSAIELFEGATVLHVPRSRQIAVKHWSDLIALWSDAYLAVPDGRLVLNPECDGVPPVVQLDPRYYNSGSAIERYFGQGVPSLVSCRTLRIEGEVVFGRDIVIEGNCTLVGPAVIADGSRLGNLTRL